MAEDFELSVRSIATLKAFLDLVEQASLAQIEKVTRDLEKARHALATAIRRAGV